MAKAKAKTADDKGGKRVRVVTETVEDRLVPDDEIDLADVDTPEDDEDADALSELEELAGSGARYEIRRTAPAPFTGYVGTYTRDVFTPDLLRQEWGGGNFTLRVKNSKGEYVGSRQIVLAGKPHDKADPVVPVATVQGGDGGMAGVLAAISAGNKAAADATNSQITLLTSLVTSLINRPAPTLPTPPDPLQMIASLKDILKPDKGDTGADAVKLLLQGLELGKELGGGGGGEMDLMGLAAKGLDTVTKVAGMTQAARPALRRPAPLRPAVKAPPALNAPAEATAVTPVTVNAPVAAEAPVITDELRKLNWLRGTLGVLVKKASQGKDPELWAEVLLDELPSFVTPEEVHERFKDPTAMTQVGFINPDVQRFPEWFEAFRAEVVRLLEEQPDDDEEVIGVDPETGEGEGGELPEGGEEQ